MVWTDVEASRRAGTRRYLTIHAVSDHRPVSAAVYDSEPGENIPRLTLLADLESETSTRIVELSLEVIIPWLATDPLGSGCQVVVTPGSETHKQAFMKMGFSQSHSEKDGTELELNASDWQRRRSSDHG